MRFGASSSKSDGGMSSAHKSMHSGTSNNTAHEDMMASTSKKAKDSSVTRPQLRTGNATMGSTGKRINPSLLQRVLDTSPTYRAVSYLGRRFDPRG